MERLTERSKDGFALQKAFTHMGEVVDRPATYEDAEERGELVRLRWIPVTERLPEESGDYLVFDDCGNLYVNEWHFLLRMWQYDNSRITHWMQLPEPPEEG